MSLLNAPITTTPPSSDLGPDAPASSAEPRPLVRVESRYDRVTSLLLAVILGASIVFGWLSLVAATTSAYNARSTPPVRVIEVAGGGGGTPDGKVGSVEEFNVPGAAASDQMSNNQEQATEFEAPLAEARPAAVLDSVVEANQDLAAVDLSVSSRTGGKVASGRARSKIGTGGPGFGFGPGDGGVRREDRWTILFKPGSTADEYARQLDFFGVELAIIEENHLVYLSHFSAPTPTKRIGSGSDDNRLYFLWRGQGRKASDLEMLARGGLKVGDAVIFQFYPAAVEQELSQLEVKFKGRQPAEIRSTRFGVVAEGDGYRFEVLSQEALR